MSTNTRRDYVSPRGRVTARAHADTTGDPVDLPAHSQRGATYLLWEACLVAGVAVGCTLLLSGRGMVMAAPALAAVLVQVDVAALPVYERSTSLRPVLRLWTPISIGLVLATVTSAASPSSIRLALASVLAVAVLPLLGRSARRMWRRPRSTLLVGDRIAVSHLVAQWGALPHIDIAGICLSEPEDYVGEQPSEVLGYAVVGGLEDAADIARSQRLDQVVVAPGPVLTAYDVRRLGWALEDCDTELAVAAEVHGAVPRRVVPRLVGRRLVLSVRPSRQPALASLAKSILDRVGAGAVLLVAAPLIFFLVVAVRLETPGGGFFSQIRTGRDGRPFRMLKLRTMVIDAEQRRAELEELNEGAGPLFKLSNDPRVTRVGGFLRRTSLDELPQLWNVVRGDMSLIGPRPALPHETDEYDDWIRRRLSIKPGMTGLWQVSGRSRLGWNDAVRLDLDYVDNWTLGGDLQIAGRTVNAVLRRDGAV